MTTEEIAYLIRGYVSGDIPGYQVSALAMAIYYKGMQIREIFKCYTDLVEPMSIDEAYLDVTTNKLGIKSAVKVAKLIQYDIWQELHLTCSAGVSYNKFIAKLASDFQKPAGLWAGRYPGPVPGD